MVDQKTPTLDARPREAARVHRPPSGGPAAPERFGPTSPTPMMTPCPATPGGAFFMARKQA
ncbi:hypothetical protein CR157_06810 [Halomonas sp. LBP4]|nr:hypothetical protein CR157_06810 [Halomonas sp. LBP4]